MVDLKQFLDGARHVVLVCGGAVSGSEAAALCASRGLLTIVVDQNPRPYGKIEDGLPRWHDKLRKQEYAKIDENLSRPNVLYVPNTKIGRDVSFEQVTRGFGLSAVLLANGAWRDRPLEVPGVDQFVDKGLAYQNTFVYWFNHFPESDYSGPRFEVPDGAIVVGGGLASIDVVKIINLDLYSRALAARGIEVSTVELEHAGIPKVLEKHGLTAEQLGIKGCTLYYRRSKREMPLASPKNDSPEEQAKTATVREKLMDNVMRKCLVRFEGNHVPVGTLVEGDRLVGLRFRRTETVDGKLREIAGSDYDVRAPLTVSSIGSVPLKMEGVPMKGELYDFTNWDTGELRGLQGVFGLGNVLTGKGNIKDSRQNAIDVGERVLDGYIGPVREQTERALDATQTRAPMTAEQVKALLAWVEQRWAAVGCDGDYATWIKRVTPAGFQ